MPLTTFRIFSALGFIEPAASGQDELADDLKVRCARFK